MLGIAGGDSKQLGGNTVDSKILMWPKMKICHTPSGPTGYSSGYPTKALPQAQQESHWPVTHTHVVDPKGHFCYLGEQDSRILD